MSPNRQLSDFLNALEGKINRSNALRELLDCCVAAGRYPAKLQYDNSIPTWCAFATGTLMAAIAFIALYDNGSYLDILTSYIAVPSITAQFASLVAVIIAASIFFASLGVIASRDHQIGEMATSLKFKAALAHNGLTIDRSPRDLTLDRLIQSFGDFARGNHSRGIEEAYTGHYARGDIRLDFSYYRLHYVNRRIETYSDAKGQTKTRVVYDHFDRYSLVIPFTWVREVSVRSDGQDDLDRDFQYRTNHPDFERRFRLTASSQMKAAKFAKPAVVVLLTELGRTLEDINLEFDANGLLCISFGDTDLLDFESPSHSLMEPEALAQAITEDMPMPKLRNLLALVQALSNACDNNFAHPQTA